MTKKIDRRQFLGTAAQVSCGCVMATGLMGCAAFTKQTGQAVGETAAEDEAIAAGSIATAYCGLYCAACSRYLDGGCGGCNQGPIGYPCQIKPCAEEKGLAACGECEEMPCETLTAFFDRGRDISVVGEKNSYRIAEVGYVAWLQEQAQRWTCEECGSSYSFNDEVCPDCGEGVTSLAEEANEYREASSS